MYAIRAAATDDVTTLAALVEQGWGSTRVAARGRLIEVTSCPALVAEDDGTWLGYCAYEIVDGSCQVVVLESLRPGSGVGTNLLEYLVRRCREGDVTRIWLITTNDNTAALRWYQRRGFELVALHRGAVTEARGALKLEIPRVGQHDIEIRDELELELPPRRWETLAESAG
jgi:ribosomal protein S18 acetylase RimI-like enzyme